MIRQRVAYILRSIAEALELEPEPTPLPPPTGDQWRPAPDPVSWPLDLDATWRETVADYSAPGADDWGTYL